MSSVRNNIDVSIVIVTWNVAELLEKCLGSIYRYPYAHLSIEIIVVDNNSTDGTVSMVQREFGDVVLIINKENVGFARANNQALEICRGRYVLLLNPDTELNENSLELLVEFLNNNPDYGAVGPKLVSETGQVWLEGGRRFPGLSDVVGEAFMLRRLFPRSKLFGGFLMSYWDHLSDKDVDSLQGACMLVPRKLLSSIGSLDPTLFMYFEDVDLCYRIRSTKSKIRYLASSVVLHVWQGSTVQSPEKEERMVKLTYQSYYFFFKKHGNSMQRELSRLIVICGGLFRVAVFFALELCSLGTQGASGVRKGLLMLASLRQGELENAGRE